MGTWNAGLMFPEFVDALAVMQPGDVSRVIETEMGFHVLTLKRPQPEQRVAARQIVIGYRDTSPDAVRPGHSPTRSRADANALATKLVVELRDEPGRFDEYVDRYSDHADALLGGDMGVWSTHRAELAHSEIAAVAELEIGAISEPVDSYVGFRIMRRTPVTARDVVAVSRLILPAPPDDTGAAALATRIRRDLDLDASRFEPLQATHCCQGGVQWESGRGDPMEESIARRLEVGSLSGPFYWNGAFLILKRIEPVHEAVAAAITPVIPTPDSIDLEHMLRTARSGEAAAAYVVKIVSEVDRLDETFSAEHRDSIKAAFLSLADGIRTEDPERRIQVVAQMQQRLRAQLGSSLYDALSARIMRRITEDMAPAAVRAGLLAMP